MLPVGGGGGRGVERGGAGGAAARAGAAHLPPPHDVPGGVGRRLPRPLRGLVCVHMSKAASSDSRGAIQLTFSRPIIRPRTLPKLCLEF